MILEKVRSAEGFALGGASASVPVTLSSFVQACTRTEPEAQPTAREELALLDALP